MILAAGRGERMRPLTDTLPKPLLRAGGKALIEYHLENLARAGFINVVINHAHLGQMIEAALGDGKRYDVNLHYSHESVALETAGGIAQALPILEDKPGNTEGIQGERPFLVINADIYCELDFSALLPVMRQMQSNPDRDIAHLVLVDNPAHHPEGDFSLDSDRVTLSGKNNLTFSGIGIYGPSFFKDVAPGSAARLAPLLREAITTGKVGGQCYRGVWVDVGTPERLRLIDLQLRSAAAHPACGMGGA
jgi:MurNAc alpha-1-phosphate uridylyltransferase